MKRIIIVCLILALLAACQPTPEQEHIVNKGDGVLEDKLNAAPQADAASGPAEPDRETVEGNAAERQLYPDRWETDPIPVSERFSIRAQADVITKADGLYPVYRSRSAAFSTEQTLRLLDLLLGKPTGAEDVTMTKEDWTKAFQQYLNEVEEKQQWIDAGRPDWGDRDESDVDPEQVEQQSRWYMEQINNAPDAKEAAATSGFAGQKLNQPKVYTLASGAQAYVFANGSTITVGKLSGEPYLWYRYDVDFEESESKFWHDPAVDRADADKLLAKELNRLGLEDFSVRRVTDACLLETAPDSFGSYVTSGLAYTLMRNPGSYPVSDVNYKASGRLEYDSGGEYIANRPIKDEEIVILINENGLQYFCYSDPKEIVGLKNANVELLPFPEVQDRIVKTLSACYPYADSVDYLKRHETCEMTLEIVRLLLTTYTIRQKDSDDYYEMPCWVVFFERRLDGPDVIHEGEETGLLANGLRYSCLILNAVDGSPIAPELGY